MVGSDDEDFLPALRRHLDERGLEMVEIGPPPAGNAAGFRASRTDPDDPWAMWAARLARASGQTFVEKVTRSLTGEQGIDWLSIHCYRPAHGWVIVE